MEIRKRASDAERWNLTQFAAHEIVDIIAPRIAFHTNRAKAVDRSEHRRQLVESAQAGDQSALERLLWEHFDELTAFLTPRMPSDLQSVVSVDDVISQTFYEAFRDFSNYEDRLDSTFTGWLTTIANHRLLDLIRRIRKHAGKTGLPPNAMLSTSADLMALLPDDGPNVSLDARLHEAEHALRLALGQLSENHRVAIILRYVEDVSIEDIASRLNCTSGSVRGILDRAKAELRDMLGTLSRFISRC